jgi:hypothetical protein
VQAITRRRSQIQPPGARRHESREACLPEPRRRRITAAAPTLAVSRAGRRRQSVRRARARRAAALASSRLGRRGQPACGVRRRAEAQRASPSARNGRAQPARRAYSRGAFLESALACASDRVLRGRRRKRPEGRAQGLAGRGTGQRSRPIRPGRNAPKAVPAAIRAVRRPRRAFAMHGAGGASLEQTCREAGRRKE